ncbi:LysR family transcriptional regulator [Microlunatus soli]|uniref:DNA-binding transcriptional regulator, LysR family n=1 Tax=Microlunatus soli TaxID=630515 RepID=A0A1H1U987_9ACTN|nr:LysR family transcriptional regulator [Microlunatus soli]SDS68957.1 DNA-binding transcriptional regulator, LysR family [Microlunatus soli]
MDVAHLELLRELADRGSVTEVARATGKTTSAVSQQLRLLQRDVGVPLVMRSGRGVRLTDAGVALARTATRVAGAIAEAEAEWDRYRQTAAGTVRLAFFFSAGELLIPGLLRRTADYPEIELITQEHDVAEGEFEPLTADHDIVIAHCADDGVEPDRRQLSVIKLLREPLDVAVALDHPLAGRQQVTAGEVIDEPWIGVPESYPMNRVLRAVAMQAGRPAKIIFRSTHLPLIEKLVADGQGIALLPRHTSRDRAAGRFALLPLTGLYAGRHLEVLSRPDRAARRAVRLVIDAVVDEAASVQA